jgi:Tfp pilus assembly protein PilX
MSDADYTLLMLLGLVTLCAVYLLAVVRSQKRLIRSLTADANAPKAAEADTENQEVEVLRKRIQVLERIATDGNRTLDREFDQLRGA